MDNFMPWVDKAVVLPLTLWRPIIRGSMSGGKQARGHQEETRLGIERELKPDMVVHICNPSTQG
jgi:hypothetical protein